MCADCVMRQVNIHAAKTQLSRLVDEAAAGEEIVIARAGKPVARLVPLEKVAAPKRRVLGILAGDLLIPDDFDTMLPGDVLDAFENGWCGFCLTRTYCSGRWASPRG